MFLNLVYSRLLYLYMMGHTIGYMPPDFEV
jgi:hypothetical protein